MVFVLQMLDSRRAVTRERVFRVLTDSVISATPLSLAGLCA